MSNEVKKQTNKSIRVLSPCLEEQLNPEQEPFLLSNTVNRAYFEEEFSSFYSTSGRPAHPVRLMVSLLILKSLYNLSDEQLVEQRWEMNACFQYFSGFTIVQWGQPCAADDLVHFRKSRGSKDTETLC